MSFQENFNMLVSQAAALGLPKIFRKYPTPKEENDRLYKAAQIRKQMEQLRNARIPTAFEEARTPTSKEVGAEFLPTTRIPPRKLSTGSVAAEPSMITPQLFQPPNSAMWRPHKITEKIPLKLSK